MNKEDKRAQRTEEGIESALLKLMGKFEYQKITIQQILTGSGYSRTAFYSHYCDKDDCLKHLLDKQIAMYVSNVLQAFVQAMQNKESVSDYTIIYKYFEHIYKEKIFYKALLCNDSFNEFKEYFYARLLKEVSKNFTVQNPGDIDKELYIYSVTFNLLGCAEYWAKEDFKFTPDYIARQFCLTRNINGHNIVVIISKPDLPGANMRGLSIYGNEQSLNSSHHLF